MMTERASMQLDPWALRETELTLGALAMLRPAAQAAVLGRGERLDMAGAALVNGISSHTFDFDDTHLKTIIHPAGPVAAAILALAEETGATGRQVIDALVLGIDVSCRVGNAMYPDHYDRGWHITGSTGTLTKVDAGTYTFGGGVTSTLDGITLTTGGITVTGTNSASFAAITPITLTLVDATTFQTYPTGTA